MFCHEYDPETPTDLRQMTTGLGGWSADSPPTVELTLALGLWNAGAPGAVRCRIGVRRPGDEVKFVLASRQDFDWAADAIKKILPQAASIFSLSSP